MPLPCSSGKIVARATLFPLPFGANPPPCGATCQRLASRIIKLSLLDVSFHPLFRLCLVDVVNTVCAFNLCGKSSGRSFLHSCRSAVSFTDTEISNSVGKQSRNEIEPGYGALSRGVTYGTLAQTTRDYFPSFPSDGDSTVVSENCSSARSKASFAFKCSNKPSFSRTSNPFNHAVFTPIRRPAHCQ